MGKTTKRVLSLVLTVLMVLSMVSVFTVPVSAETTVSSEVGKLDYDAIFKDEKTFLINADWDNLSELKKGDKLYFWFRGVDHEIKYNPEKHFGSYADAYNAIWSGLNAENYFDYRPTIIFAPGEYDEPIPVHSVATILGAHAGISPNEKIADSNWNINWLIGKSGIIGQASNRKTYNETILYQPILFSTRTEDPETGAWSNEVLMGEDAKYHYFRETACNENKGKSLDYVIDGIRSEASAGIDLSGADKNRVVSYGKDKDGNDNKPVTIAGGRKVNVYANNFVFAGSSYLVGAWNTNDDVYTIKFDNLRSIGSASNFVQRYIDHVEITNSYITGWSGSLTNASLTNAKHTGTSFTIKKSVIANGPSGNTAVFTGTAKQTGFTLNLEDNLMYNISGATWGAFRIDCTSAIDVVLNIKNNDIFHSTANTLFNGNTDYITAGNYAINFNGNRVVSKTLQNIPPNSSYPHEKSSTILNYNFDGNYFSKSFDDAGLPTGDGGLPVTFVYGPNGNAPLASGWDYNDPNYFYDYDMIYSSHGLKVTEADFGENNLVEFDGNVITVRCLRTPGSPDEITPVFKTSENANNKVPATIDLSTDPNFIDTPENNTIIDKINLKEIAENGGTKTYYLRARYEGTEYEARNYTVKVISKEPVEFNEKFRAEGLTFAGHNLEYKNTAVLVGKTEKEGDDLVSYGFIGNEYYRFIVDNELVFNNLTSASSQMKAVDDPYVLIPSGEYYNVVLPFAATYLGTNAEIQPVKRPENVAVLDDTPWSLGNGWGDRGESRFDTINIADGVEGDLVIKGVTIRGQFNDTLRTYGKGGKVYGTLNVTLENSVLDQPKYKSFTNPVTKEVKAEGFSGCDGSLYAINLMNRRSVNFDEMQPEETEDGIKEIFYGNFGDTYNDSFTLKNFWVKSSVATKRFINEFVPAHVTLDTVYRDVKASQGIADGSDTKVEGIVGWIKTGILNKNNSFTMTNCNFRNATEVSSDHPFVGFEGASGAPAEYKVDTTIIAGGKYELNISNNIFANANRDKLYDDKIAKNQSATPQSYILLSPAYMSSIKINDNFVLNEDKPNIYFISHVAKHDPGLNKQDAVIRGNIEINNNSLIGFSEGKLLKPLLLGDDEPELSNTFYTADTLYYKTNATAGVFESSMGDQPYWYDFARTRSSGDYKIHSVTAKTEYVRDIALDNLKLTLNATIKQGSLADLDIVIHQNATGLWYDEYTNPDTHSEPFDPATKTIDKLEQDGTFYYVVTKDETPTVYSVSIYTGDKTYFVENYTGTAYYDKTAYILSSKARAAAAGSLVDEDVYNPETKETKTYTFVVGVNAFANVKDAVTAAQNAKKAAEGTDTVGNDAVIIVSKAYADDTFRNGANNLIVYGPAKIYGPTFNLAPVDYDAFGTKSPSQGNDWRLNPEFDINDQAVVKDIVIDGSATGNIEVYGFTCTGGVEDKSRKYNNTADIHLENIYFTGTNKDLKTLFSLSNDYKLADGVEATDDDKNAVKNNESSFTLKNAYFDIERTSAVAFIATTGDVAPASITFDTLYMDIAKGAVKDTSTVGYSVNRAADNCTFTIKNSYFKNADASANFFMSFGGYVNDPFNAKGTATGVWASGRSNAIIFEDNIFSGFTAKKGDVSSLMYIKEPFAYTQITVKGNYISGVNGQSVSLFGTPANLADAPANYKAIFTVTDNIINGFADSTYGIGSDKFTTNNSKWVIKDNFVTELAVNDILAEGVGAYVPMYNAANMQDGNNLEYSHKLDVSGTVATNRVYDMTYVGGVVIDGNKMTVNLPDGTGVITSGNIVFANLVKKNDMHNILRVKTADGYFDARESVAVADVTGFEVRSADGKSQIAAYNVTVNVVDKAQEFKHTFVDTNPIENEAGVKEPIQSSALMVSGAFAGLTGTVNAEWLGESYSFVMNENAFATVGDALTYAKTNNLTNVQILFKNDTAAEVNFGITYPCAIYTENYNVMPYVTDGYGPDSPSHGVNWTANAEYLANQTIADVIWLDANFTGKFEINGITLRNTFIDAYRTKGNTADIIFRNTLVDAKNSASMTAANAQKITGLTALGSSTSAGWQSATIFRFVTDKTKGSLYNDANNSLLFKNMYMLSSKVASRFACEFVPAHTTFDGVYINDATASGLYMAGATNIKQTTADSTFVIKNSNFQNFYPANKSRELWSFYGSYNTTKLTDSQNLEFTNNIFNSFESRTSDGNAYLFGVCMTHFKSIKITNNYIASPSHFDNTKPNVGFIIPRETSTNISKIATDIEITRNAINAESTLDIAAAAGITVKVEENYKVPNGYDADVINKSAKGELVGEPVTVVNHTPTVNTYCLDYNRTIKSSDVVYPSFAALDNVIIENEKLVSYIADAKVSDNEGKLTGNIAHIIAKASPYSKLYLVVDGAEKELATDFADATDIAIRVYSIDNTNKEDITVQVVASTNHVFKNYVNNGDATCKDNATATAVCTGACGDANCTAKRSKVLPDSTIDHKLDMLRGKPKGEATCQKNDFYIYTCTVCGETEEIEREGSKAAHVYVNYVDYGPATCHTYGTEKGKCKWCGAEDVRDKLKGEVNPKVHDWGEWIYNGDLSCTKNGTETRKCKGTCGESETRDSAYYTIDKVVHNLGEFKYDGNASCNVDGTMTARCKNDGCRYKVTVADPAHKANAIFHEFGEYKNDNNATCCENGTQTSVCAICGAKQTVELPGSAKGHKGGATALTDVKTDKWYTDAIDYVVTHNYIAGVSDTEFGISVNITRGMFVTILARIAGVDTSSAANKAASSKFTDVKAGRYYAAAVAWANKAGVVSGKSDTTFEPNTAISRQELAVMLVNFAKACNITLNSKTDAITFADASSIAKWAKKEVALCQKAGIISGYKENGTVTFKPTNTATRAEAAQMIYKFAIEYIAK